MNTSAIRTLVVDDSDAMLEAMCSHLTTLPAINLVGAATSGREAVSKAAMLMPALVVLDFQLGGMTGLEAAKRIKTSTPSAKTIIVTIHDGPRLRAAVMADGVDGFLSKSRFRQDIEGELVRLFPEFASRLERGRDISLESSDEAEGLPKK